MIQSLRSPCSPSVYIELKLLSNMAFILIFLKNNDVIAAQCVWTLSVNWIAGAISQHEKRQFKFYIHTLWGQRVTKSKGVPFYGALVFIRNLPTS